jgi:uncharacterized membrane protein YtjA (UPF0391 family)
MQNGGNTQITISYSLIIGMLLIGCSSGIDTIMGFIGIILLLIGLITSKIKYENGLIS